MSRQLHVSFSFRFVRDVIGISFFVVVSFGRYSDRCAREGCVIDFYPEMQRRARSVAAVRAHRRIEPTKRNETNIEDGYG